MNYTANQISKITGAKIIGNKEAIIKDFAFDTRHIYSAKNTAFIALKTTNNNGENYIPEAIEKGIKIIVAEKKTTDTPNITWIITNDSLAFLQNLAQFHAENKKIKTIGITGSNGKTIVKEWLYQCLNEKYKIVKSPKSFNSQLGLPLSLLKINDEHEIGLFEVGISKPQEMEIQQRTFSPEIGVLTHIGTAHLINFESTEQLIREKIKLFAHSQTIIFNGDQPLVLDIIQKTYPDKQLISYGLLHHNDIHLKTPLKELNLYAEVSCYGDILRFPVHQKNEATLTNALCVISVLKKLNFGNDEIVEKINVLKAIEMRLESVNGIRDNLIINDSYILDLDSLKIAYQFINEYNKPCKSLVITDFAEQNNESGLYQEVAALTNEQNFDKVFLIGTEIKKYKPLFKAKTFTFNDIDELIKNQILNKISNELILLKGARKFEIEKLKNHLELQKHDTVLEINLNKILHNINVHREFLEPKTKVMAMVKAYSYGLGGYEIAEFLQHHHIDYLGVAVADEGIDLRKNGISVPIIVMNPEQHSYNAVIDYNLEPNIYSFRVLDLFVEQLRASGYNGKYPIHIKIETGMHRLGFKENDIDELITKLNTLNVKVGSIFSHLSSADIPEEKGYTEYQLKVFRKISDKIIDGIGYQPIRHILNSAGITNYPKHQYDMVRIGIGMIGISSNESIIPLLLPAVSFKTVISQISEIKKGESIGYGRRHIAENNMRVATIPVGYADGIPRSIGMGIGYVGVGGNLCPILGSVCMDMMMIDLKNISAQEGDSVIIFDKNPSLEDFANYCKTIPYEVLTSISRRVKRVYVKD